MKLILSPPLPFFPMFDLLCAFPTSSINTFPPSPIMGKQSLVWLYPDTPSIINNLLLPFISLARLDHFAGVSS